METLLDTPHTKIQVDCAANYEVCDRCKGSGTLYETILPFDSGQRIAWMGMGYSCPRCRGKGFWKK